MSWLVEEVGGFLGRNGPDDGDGPDDIELSEDDRALGRAAVMKGAEDVNTLLHSAYAAHEVVATELRMEGPLRGGRRTMFAEMPSPVALMLLCLRLCDEGDAVTVMHHTAATGVVTREGVWPFGMAEAEEITRPPSRPAAEDLPVL